jgi:hypothetical protein
MRGFVLAAVAVLGAGQAGAGCFTREELPQRAVYDQGSALEYLGLEDDVLTYRVGSVTTRMKDGLWPLEHVSGDQKTEFRWDGLLPDLASIVSDGGTAEVRGRMRHGGGGWLPVVARVEVLGQTTKDWEDCRYDVVEFRKVLIVDGKTTSEGVVLYAPGAMIAFRTDAVAAEGATTSFALTELH